MRKTFVKIISLDLTDELPRVKAPTLLYWGAEDTETPLWMGKMMEEKIPDAGVVLPHPAGESVKARTVLPKDLGQGLVHRCRPADVPDENGPPAGTQDPAALPRKGRTVEPVEGLGRCDHVHGPVRQPGIMVRSI